MFRVPPPSSVPTPASSTATPAHIPPTRSSSVAGKRSRSVQGRGKSRIKSKPYIELDDDVKREEVETPIPPVITPAVKRRAKTAETDMKPVRYPHNIECPPFPHNGRIPAPSSDLREDMLTCDNCWYKQKTNLALECLLVNGHQACLRCQQSRVKSG